MTHEEKRRVLEELGIPGDSAEFYLGFESDIWAILPVFRLLKPLNDDLVFYQGGYKKLIERYQKEGKLAERMPAEARLVESGASPEDIEKLAYDLTLQAYEMLLYRMDDREGAESPADDDTKEAYEKCGYWKLVEMSQDGKPTGRYLHTVHGYLPFSLL